MALKDSKSFWRPARENEAKCVFHVMLWFHFLVSTQPFPLNSTQLYELLSCQCAFPTESAVALMHPPGKNTGTFLERAARVKGAWDWNHLIQVSAERQSAACGSFFHSLKHLSHVRHLNEQKIQSREIWVTSRSSTTLPAVPPRCCVDDRRLCVRVCAPTCSPVHIHVGQRVLQLLDPQLDSVSVIW